MVLEGQISAAEVARDKRTDEAAAILQAINKLALIRAAKARRALYEESYPPPAPGLGERIGAALRGR